MKQFYLIFVFSLFQICLTCGVNEFELTIEKVYTKNAQHESFYLYYGSVSEGEFLISMEGTYDKCNSIETAIICGKSGSYTIDMKDSYGDGWGEAYNPAYVAFYNKDILLWNTTMPYKFGTEYKEKISSYNITFNIFYNDTWTFVDTPQNTSDWSTLQYDDSNWLRSETQLMPIRTAITRYYRHYVSLKDLTNVVSISLNYNIPIGCILYINGQEFHRHNMPLGNIDSQTLANRYSNETEFNTVHISKNLFVSETSFVVAIETHNYETITSISDIFDIVLFTDSLVPNACTRSLFTHGQSLSIPEGNSPDHLVSTIFDDSTTTFYRTYNTSTPVFYYYTHHNYIWLNHYHIADGLDTSYGDPASWILSASNTEIDILDYKSIQFIEKWTTLDMQYNNSFVYRQETHKFTLSGNKQSFNLYRLTLLKSSNATSLALSIFSSFACNIENPPLEFSYIPSSLTMYNYITEGRMIPLFGGYTNFTIYPNLPEGMTINQVTGTIQGTPTIKDLNILNKEYTFEIKAIDVDTSVAAFCEIKLHLLDCAYPSMARVQFHKQNNNGAYSQSYSISYTPAASESPILLYTSPSFTPGKEHLVNLCLPISTEITITLKDYFFKQWPYNNLLQYRIFNPQVNQYHTINQWYYIQGITDNVTINTSFDIQYQDPHWYYVQNFIYSGWNTDLDIPDYFQTYNFSSLPQSNSLRWCFRRNFALDSFNSYTGFELHVLARAGINIYINGMEVYRRNIPSGALTNTTTATASDDTSLYRHISVSLSFLKLHSMNTLSIFIANMENKKPEQVLFDCSMLFYYSNHIHGRTWDISITDSPSGKNVKSLVDWNENTVYENQQNTKQTISIISKFGNQRSEYINTYCFQNSNKQIDYDISSWSLYGSNSDTFSTLLDTISYTTFIGRLETRCFYITQPHLSYHNYKLDITSIQNPESKPYLLLLTQILFDNENLATSHINPFIFPSELYSSYYYVPFPFLNTTLLNKYHHYSYSPSLPSPLTVDSTNGRILGIPDSSILLKNTKYIISAYDHQNQLHNTTLSLSLNQCTYPNVYIQIHIHSISNNATLKLSFETKTRQVLFTNTGFVKDFESIYPFCIPMDTYVIVLSDFDNFGYGSGYMSVSLIDGKEILRGSMGIYESFRIFSLNLNYRMTPFYSIWKYTSYSESISSDWKSLSYNDTLWDRDQVHSLKPSVSRTQYFRHLFTIDSYEQQPSIALDIKTKYGFVVYINGDELFRNNLPDGVNITPTTEPTTVYDIPIYKGMSISTIRSSYAHVGTNILAIEIHYNSTSTQDIDFDIAFLYGDDNDYRVHDGTASLNNDIDGTVMNLFDNTIATECKSGPSCVGSILYYNYTNPRREVVNSYSLTTSNSCNSRHPSDYIFEGSNSQFIWVTLHIATNISYPLYRYTVTFDFYNDISFQKYRLRIIGCNNTAIGPVEIEEEAHCHETADKYGLQLSEIQFFSKPLLSFCESEDGYGRALENTFSYKECPLYYEGRQSRLCLHNSFQPVHFDCDVIPPLYVSYYNHSHVIAKRDFLFDIHPLLACAECVCTSVPNFPNTVQISEAGIISGIMHELFVGQFNITCANSKGAVSTRFYLTVIEKEDDHPSISYSWILYLLVTLTIIILIIIAILFLKKKKLFMGKKLVNSEENMKFIQIN